MLSFPSYREAGLAKEVEEKRLRREVAIQGKREL